MKWVEHWNVAMMGYVTGDRHLIAYGLDDPGGGLTSGKVYCDDRRNTEAFIR